MTKRILDLVDMQNDFMAIDGRLSIEGADKIASKANQFLKNIKSGIFDYAFVKLDTHFTQEYTISPEHTKSKFPEHCDYGTDGWKLSVDVSQLKNKTKVMFLGKNVFDMWRANDYRAKLKFDKKEEEIAYNNLFKFTSDEKLQNTIEDMNPFIEKNFIPQQTEVVLIGVASDYCCLDAIKGYLIRGFNVTVLEDLTRGIKKQMDFVCKKNFNREMKSNRLVLTTSEEFLNRK